MILETLTRPKVRVRVFESLRRRENGNDITGEDRLVLSGISWEQYLNLDRALGDDRPDPHFYYVDGELEIMSTSLLHEKLKKWIGDLVGDYLVEIGIEAFPHGQATMRILREAGAEPDESWCLNEEKEFPDLVLEIALTSGAFINASPSQKFGFGGGERWKSGRCAATFPVMTDQRRRADCCRGWTLLG